MEWIDQGIILGTRRHGETSLIAELMTESHGRHLGLVRGGRSRRNLPTLQAGNSVTATWRARLHDHLGTYAVEVTHSRAARLMEEPFGLHMIQSLAALLRLLPERDPHPELYAALAAILDVVDQDKLLACSLMVRFELRLLDELGFGLDLEECAGGGDGDLVYVSPKSGRAVSSQAGAPYKDRLMPLPAFLHEGPRREAPPADAVVDGFALTAYFLDRHVYHPRGLAPSDSRRAVVALAESLHGTSPGNP